MDPNQQEKIQKTLDFIQKDRIIPDDPWFYSRLIARMENEEVNTRTLGMIGSMALRLRPVLAVVIILVGITGGIFLGKALTPPSPSPESTLSVFLAGDDANAVLLRELSGSMDEQILLMK